MIKNELFINERNRTYTRVTTYDAAVVMTEAQFQKENSRNGMFKGGTGRSLGEIPLAEFLEMQRLANERGEELTGKDIKEYLKKNPEYLTCNGLDTGHHNGSGLIRVNK